MATNRKRATEAVDIARAGRPIEEIALPAPSDAAPARKLRPGGSRKAVDARSAALGLDDAALDALRRIPADAHMDAYASLVEHCIGAVQVPLGVAGPLRIRGLNARGDFFVPLATSESALVASYNRGAAVVTASGGCAALLLNEGVQRSPGLRFASLEDAGRFVAWASTQFDAFREAAQTTTRFGALVDVRFTIDGRLVYLAFEFRTGDAAGQNMVTFATEAICADIRARSPIRPEVMFLEANLSGDKKACAQSFQSVRGRKVSAEVLVPRRTVEGLLRTTPERMHEYWTMSAIGGVLSGCLGIQGHFANGLAALALACGQDVACVAESAVGTTRMEVDASGGLYACVTLPNLMFGTVGGGTSLPTAAACLGILGLRGAGSARALCEVAAATLLAGELSIVGALCAEEFARAHFRRARGRSRSRGGST
jgi:hydroxymethylglutaryl-CoA reductase (NADPH)